MIALAIFMGALFCGCSVSRSGNLSAKGGSASITSSGGVRKTVGNRLVGISMPSDRNEQWVEDATTIQSTLEQEGYTVEVAYAGDDSKIQIDQVNAMLDDDCGTILVAAVDSDALSKALRSCDTSNSAIIAYSVMVPDCDKVNYFIGINSYASGQIQAKYLVKKLKLKNTKKSYNLEIFHPSGNGSALYAFRGAMDVLQPYLDNGTLVIPSGDQTAEECGVANAEKATQRLDHLLETTYADGKSLDAVLCTDDSITVGVVKGLNDSYSGSVFPVITGCNCNAESVGLLMNRQLDISSVAVTDGMAEQAAKMTDQAMRDKQVDQSQEDPFGVPAYLYEPDAVTIHNDQEKLFDSGLFIKKKDGTISAAQPKTAQPGEQKSDGKTK